MSENKKVCAGNGRLPRDGKANGDLLIEHLFDHERDMLVAMIAGECRVESVEGRLVRRSLYEPMPAPAEDPVIGPHWTRDGEPKMLLVTAPENQYSHTSPAIAIQSLCGYRYTPENYVAAAETLESWGFICLRSRKGADGKYWEIWYLPGFWSAEGQLKKRIEYIGGKKWV